MKVTLEHVQAKQAEIAVLIERLVARPAPSVTHLVLENIDIELREGERYAGATLNDDGTIKHHVVLLAARPEADVNWEAAKTWASAVGGALPDRQEQALLFANCKAVLPQRWCWSNEANGSSYAWYCYFNYGCQYYIVTSCDGFAVAVRRLTP